MKYKLPFEQLSKDEAQVLKSTWKSGAFHFLLQRTEEKYNLKNNKLRRTNLEEYSNTRFPLITDQMLFSLYRYASTKYLNYCKSNYNNYSGFSTTPSEKIFLKSIESIIKNNPKLKHLEIYPSNSYIKDLPPNFKMVIGNYVPDFLVFGLKIKGFSAVAFEVDGDSHINKHSKDELRNAHLKELKIFTIEIPNNQVNDITYLTNILKKTYRLRNGSFNQQIQRVKRLIWLKTICCQLSLAEIENYIRNNFNVQLNLNDELNILKDRQLIPRKIKHEINAILGSKQHY